MSFDKDHPPLGSLVVSPQLRENFVQLAKNFCDSIAPPDPEIGYWWIDNVDPDNLKLKVYGRFETWVTLFEHLESTPIVSAVRHEATRDPLPTDNWSKGFINFHLWLNTTSKEVFVLTDAPTGVWKSITSSSATGGGIPSRDNKQMVASVTVNDGDLACSVGVVQTPLAFGYVTVQVNGVTMPVGNGVKNRSCYFSADGGVTAKTWPGVAAGDRLYWIGSVAEFQLSEVDVVEFFYDVAA